MKVGVVCLPIVLRGWIRDLEEHKKAPAQGGSVGAHMRQQRGCERCERGVIQPTIKMPKVAEARGVRLRKPSVAGVSLSGPKR